LGRPGAVADDDYFFQFSTDPLRFAHSAARKSIASHVSSHRLPIGDQDHRGIPPALPATIHINRKKNGQSTTHQISGSELRELRKLEREQDPKSAFVFVTERGFETAAYRP
jgi:hypothetical protein